MSKWRHEILNYTDELNQFIRSERLPHDWFSQPDHVAVKAYNSADFARLLQEIRGQEPGVEDISVVELDGRRLATAFMAGPIAVGSFGEVQIVEIMEPRPEKVGKDKVGLDHVEFYQPDFAVIERRLMRSGVQSETNHNSSHSFLSITFGKDHKELKFTNRGLEDIVGGR